MSEDDDLKTYLTRATRGPGLGQRRRHALRAELLGHVEARVQELRIAGHSDAEALRRTLRELGAADHVHSGMQRVYLWPQALRGTVLGSLACGAVYTLLHLSSVLAQVQGYHPSFTPLPGPWTYVETSSLRSELRKAGVQVHGSAEAPVLNFPGQSLPVRVNAAGGGDFVSRTLIRDYPTGQVFLDLNAVAGAAVRAGLDVRVEGWINPRVFLGPVSLTLGTPEQPLEAYNLYHVALEPLARRLGLGDAHSARLDGVSVFSHHNLKVSAPAGGIYALVSVQRLPSRLGRGMTLVLGFDLAPLTRDGQLHFRMPYDSAHLTLAADPSALKADVAWLRGAADPRPYAGAGHPAQAVLLRLNGHLGGQTYQVVPRSGPSVGDQY